MTKKQTSSKKHQSIKRNYIDRRCLIKLNAWMCQKNMIKDTGMVTENMVRAVNRYSWFVV